MSYISPLGRPVRVGVFEHDPDAFHCFRKVPEGKCLKPGSEMEIIDIVMKILGWQWVVVDTEREFNVVNDFGSLQDDGNFSGIMGLLAGDLIDMGGLSMRITPERMKAAHFTFPIRYFQQAYIIRKPAENDFRNIIFSPFNFELWIILAATFVGISIYRFFLSVILLSVILSNVKKRKLQRISDSLLETYGVILKQRLPDPLGAPFMIVEAAMLMMMLVLRGNYQSVMNSRLSAPSTAAIPFYHQDRLLDLLEKKTRYPTYYFNFTLEGSNDKNEERIPAIFHNNPVVTHMNENRLIKEIQKGGVFYTTDDLNLTPDPISVFDKKQGLTMIRDTTGIISYVAFGFSISNVRLRDRFNKSLMEILPGIPQLTTRPGYAQKKAPLNQHIVAKQIPLSVKRHLEQLFLWYGILIGLSVLTFIAEFVYFLVRISQKTKALWISTNISTPIDLQLFE